MPQITLNNESFIFDESYLPCIITWAEKSWASYFSICLVANLIQQWSKVIFFTAFPMAKEELYKQIWTDKTFEINSDSDLSKIPNDKSIIIQSWNLNLRKKTIQNIENNSDYIIFVKNIEEYDTDIWQLIWENSKIILSWDIDKCKSKDVLLNFSRQSKIIFTEIQNNSERTIPQLNKYESYLLNDKIKWIIKLL